MKTNKEKTKTLSSNLFPVVGIGASAGGLDAFKNFVKAIPENSGMAYVLVQHLDPTHESLLPTILQKITTIPVLEISDDIKVEPDHIYIIPSNKMLVANDGVLLLSPRSTKKNERNLPIDLFFASLAEVHQSHSIGVVLSGTASDGTKGLKAIKDHGGITFSQDEESAPYAGMPHSAIMAGVVDFILPPGEIPKRIFEIKQQLIRSDEELEKVPKPDEDVFRQILSLLRIRKGIDFTYYKQPTIRRRILRRMALNKNEKPAEYLAYLRENKGEQDILYQDLLIPVTSFFRDHKVFDNLCQSVFPHIIKTGTDRSSLRIWVAGCSTGQEVYSIAICIKEVLRDKDFTDAYQKVQIFATDISETAIEKARMGIYSQNEIDDLSPKRRDEFFEKNNGNYRIIKQVRDMCVFSVHNFVKDPPFSKINFISCRNVLIYMEPYLQKKALTSFHYALSAEGFLLLGKSETISSVPDLFAATGTNDKLFTRKNVPGRFMHTAIQRKEPALPDLATNPESENIYTGFQKAADQMVLDKYSPAGVVINEAMDIVHFRGDTGSYLKQSTGKPSHNLLNMAKEGLAFELRNILHKAKKDKAPILKENIPVQVNGALCNISIEAIPLPGTIDPHYLILFHDNNPTHNKQSTISGKKIKTGKTKKGDKDLRIRQLEGELAQAREDMRSITEDQETANEELQSANEELLSGSEELQSLNEELETGKEELQSTVEELTIVNQEMISLNEQVTAARDYSESIIANIRESLVVLDSNQRIVTANSSFYKTFRVNEQETEGALIYDIGDKQWNIPELRILLEKILPEKSIFNDFEVIHSFSNIGERTMLLNAREAKNDRSHEKLILLSIEDITEKKKAQEIVNESSSHFQQLVKGLPAGVYSCDAQGHINFYNSAAAKLWGREPEIGKEQWCGSWKIFGTDGSQIPLDSCPMALAVKEGRSIMGEELIIERPDGTRSNVLIYPQQEFGLSGEVTGAINMVFDITELVKANKRIKESEERFRYLVEQTLSPICIFKGENMILEVANEPVFKIWNVGKEALGKPFLETVPEMKDQPFMGLLSDVFRNGVTHHGNEWPAYFARKDKEKEDLYFNFVFQPYREQDKRISGVFVFANDVTEQVIAKNKNLESQESRNKELEDKVQQRTVELSEANKSLQQKNQEIALSKYNKRFLTEFSEKFSAYKLHNEFFNSLVLFIADTTCLDYVLVGKLDQNDDGSSFIQTIALSAFGKLAENISYSLQDGPCEQVIRGTLYSYPKHCRQTFPNNTTIEQFNVEGYLGYPLNNENGNPVGLIAVMHEKEIEDAETVSSVLKIVAKRTEIELERIRYEEQLVVNNKILEEKNGELVRLNKELQSFTYISSHDLQEPLRKIQTFSNRLLGKEYAVLSDKGKEDFSRIQDAASRMQKLIEDLLAYSRTNVSELKFENTSLNDIIEETKKELAEIIQEKNAVIETGELVNVNIIPFQFRQVMNNLIANALKFSRSGVAPHIIIKSNTGEGIQFQNDNPELADGMLSPQKKYCHISVADNGIGFDPQYKDQIFEVFQRLHGKDEYPGTGIGLAIVKKIIDNHNGIIIAASEPDKGAVFNIYIPVP
ncbi:MAG: chemotaxis protein CheB [Chitinophagaceae bacterium]